MDRLASKIFFNCQTKGENKERSGKYLLKEKKKENKNVPGHGPSVQHWCTLNPYTYQQKAKHVLKEHFIALTANNTEMYGIFLKSKLTGITLN